MPMRQPCPPGACECQREVLLEQAGQDIRILQLTREEEKKLLARLESLRSLDDLRHMQQRLKDLLGLDLRVEVGAAEVRTVRGLTIELQPMPGLCRKTRQTVPAAVRRGLDANVQIVFDLLNENDLLRGL